MRDVARDPAALERLRVQRSRLADRMRPPWWYQSGTTLLWALVFALPFYSRHPFSGVVDWLMAIAIATVLCLWVPWWYRPGWAFILALASALPLNPRYLPHGVPTTWATWISVGLVIFLMQWGLTRATGIRLPEWNLRRRSPDHLAGIAMLVVSPALGGTEYFLIERGLIVAAIAVAVLGVVAEMALLQAAVRFTRRELRGGGGAA